MISHHAPTTGHGDVWAQIAALLPPAVIEWRQDGRPVARDGKYFARFVAYIEANTVRERLDSVVPGEWCLTLEPLPQLPSVEDNAVNEPAAAAFKARLQILGVVREDVGVGKDYKQAATDAFKRAAVRFGIAAELYSYEQNWVQVDGDGRYAKPLEDPAVAYARRSGPAPVASATNGEPVPTATESGARTLTLKKSEPAKDVPPCPKCGGRVWDNRIGKRNSRAPDFKCRDRTCDGVIWPPKSNAESGAVAEPQRAAPLNDRDDDLPF